MVYANEGIAILFSTCQNWLAGARKVPLYHPEPLCKSTLMPPVGRRCANVYSITGTPSGIGWGRKPKVTMHGGDEFVVEILPHIGSLYNVMEEEK